MPGRLISELTDASEVSKAELRSGMKSGPVHDTAVYHRFMNTVKKTFALSSEPENGLLLPQQKPEK
jgi:hypothetical protein